MKTVLIASLLFASAADGKDVLLKVAVIDSGINTVYYNSTMLCDYGHRDFSGTTIEDTHGHGTNISGIIDQYAKNIFLSLHDDRGTARAKIDELAATKVKYCQVIIKYWDPKQTIKADVAFKQALRWAINLHVN